MRRCPILRYLLCLSAVLLLIGCDKPPSTALPMESGKPLLIFERVGGIAGFQDHLVIGYNGEFYLRQGSVERIGSLSAERTIQLRQWFTRLAPFTLRLEDNPGMPDNMVRQVVWAGLGRVTVSQAEQQQILKWVSDLLTEMATR